ncbi:LYR motif-containing protein 2 [Arctopsyche grandis]|uniref:LYR motif-containing protein 2 n=1 Tax=Arctopsyche grandis TaxID=121162 RepID=UPI00406D9079
MTKLPNSALNLKQFLLRGEVKKLYRDVLRTIRQVPDERNREELRDWARSDFKNNKNHTDEIVIKMMIQHGQKALRELKTSLDLSK